MATLKLTLLPNDSDNLNTLEPPQTWCQCPLPSKLLWEVSVPAEGTAELTIEYGIKVW